MRLRFPQSRATSVFAALALASGVCGASPQEGRTPRPRPETVREMPSPAPSSGPSYSPKPSLASTGGIEGRVARPRPSAMTELPGGRVNRVSLYPGTRVVIPPAWERCRVMPDGHYWRQRDLMAEIQGLSRRGFVPVTDVGDSVEALTDYVLMPAGWRAYGISVPVGGTVQVEVQHPSLAWFRLMLVDKWGRPGPGMLQAAIAHQPVLVTYKNPGKEALAVYIVVDDPAWWSDAKNPYTLMIRRDWDPLKTDLSMVKKVAGLWGASPSVSAEFRGPSLTGPAVYPR